MLEKMNLALDMEDPKVWAQCLHKRAGFFKRATPIAMENVSIVQHHDALQYAPICSNIYRPQLRRFSEKIMFICIVRRPRLWTLKQGVQFFV